MADSLFDNRYRYDYIYPRGRSGETLRAVDTESGNRAVVIKRPAPNDAPPIRAGQEVSILNERKALQRLAGHPVLTELLGTGQFSVGGTPHQYIVMERAEGAIIADLILELSTRGETLPELEMLVITDYLLDLLQAAHERDIVYNDVDAKHLFWDRDRYRLKIIDWGNAVFLEGDEITPQGVSRQSDVAQVGELLYFILTGGRRVEVPRDAGDHFLVDFGDEGGRIHSRLQAIVSKAIHPNPRQRYATVTDLRKDLADYRAPIQRERDTILSRVSDRLRRDRSRDELNGLLQTLEPALALDPGYPSARELHTEIQHRLQDIAVSADLDAIRIYMENGNWSRTVHLLDELRHKAHGPNAILINLLLDMSVTMADADRKQVPASVRESVRLIFEGDASQAAFLLMTRYEDDEIRRLQWLLAEQISAHYADVQLLRPNLYRLEMALAQLVTENVPVTEPQAVVTEINATLNAMSNSANLTLSDLRDNYRAVVDGLTALQTLLDAVNTGRGLPDRRLPLSALERALNAAMALADNMHVIGKQAASSPRDATAALDSSRFIDPMNGSWEVVSRRLDALYELLGSYQTYVPSADGSDLDDWFKTTRADLEPFIEYFFDEILVGMAEGVEIAGKAWAAYANATVQGNRTGTVEALVQATDAVGTISPTLAGWFNQLRTVVANASYVERHALYGGLGRALADGWESFDRGRLGEAEQLGQRAYEIAQSDPQRFAANRLQKLAEITRNWVERNGINQAGTTRSTLAAIEQLFTVDENDTLENFTRQMPTKDTYLKAMNKGLVELYSRRSTAAVRILFVYYVLMGALDAHEESLEDAEFWHQAALRTLENHAEGHIAARTLGEFILRRRDVLAGAALVNRLNGSQALPMLDIFIEQLEENAQSRLLAAAAYSLRELQAALRDWSDGEFRQAGNKLENAINGVSQAEQAAGITLTEYRTWLMDLQAATAELHTRARTMQSIIDKRPDQPDPVVLEGHRHQLALTVEMLGQDYADTLRDWGETYEAFLDVYTDTSVRRSGRLTRFNELFRAMFIDRHPAYPLYRHWYDLTEQAPEFPAPPTDEPTPQIDESDITITEFTRPHYDDRGDEVRKRPGGGIPRLALLGGLGGIAAIVLLLVLVNAPEGPPVVAVTISATPTEDVTGTAVAASVIEAEATEEATPEADETPQTVADFNTPTLIPTTAAPTEDDSLTATDSPTETDTPGPTDTATAVPTETPIPTATNTPTPTLPPQGIQGQQDLLGWFQNVESSTYPWDSSQFSIGTDGTFWRMGVGSATQGDIIYVEVPPALLEARYGNNAASRIRRMEVTLTLTTFNPPLLLDNEVYFGALLRNADDADTSAGLEVQLVQAGVINLAQRMGDDVRTMSQRTVSAAAVRVRLERDMENGTITVFANDEQLGQPMSLAAADAPVIPVLFVKDGGVIVSVSDWRITLR